MTLIITEVSSAGVAMLSDTMIREVGLISGQILTGIPPTYQRKLFVLPPLGPLRLWGAVSYWGGFGHMVKNKSDFEPWLAGVVSGTSASSLREFADKLAAAVNEKCQGRTLQDNVGFHVAGFDSWEDVVPRPTFFHVHNGHLHTKLTQRSTGIEAMAPTGSKNSNQPTTPNEGKLRRIVATAKLGDFFDPDTVRGDRGEFKVHRDFPKDTKSRDENFAVLNDGYLTANGQYFRLTIEREYDTLWQKQGIIPLAAKPTDNGYLEKRLAWMVNSAEKIAFAMAKAGEPASFGPPYQELAFSHAGLLISRGPGLDTGIVGLPTRIG